jgi:hypothetical protein
VSDILALDEICFFGDGLGQIDPICPSEKNLQSHVSHILVLNSLFVLSAQLLPPRDGRGFTISGNLKSFEGPVINCRVSRNRVVSIQMN